MCINLPCYLAAHCSLSQLHCASVNVSRHSKCQTTDKSLIVLNSPFAACFGPSPSLPLAPCVAPDWFGSTVASTIRSLCRPLTRETPLGCRSSITSWSHPSVGRAFIGCQRALGGYRCHSRGSGCFISSPRCSFPLFSLSPFIEVTAFRGSLPFLIGLI